ncbi:type II toxin-antitoxin system VapC family toxin [Pendulispora albinea]|uniref:Ribonuclease VapC n=1 Tax=Pendulispora albinea TaxID=2741071 RepID=A0ABZ2LM02_9BACT
MSFLLDTNVVSELRKGKRANAAVLRWMAQVADDEIHLSVLVVAELRQGIERLRRRDPAGAEPLERWLSILLRVHGDRIFGVDLPIADLWGRLNVPHPLPAVDGLLAATALVHDLTVVTRNVQDVARTGARVLDPFAA